MSDTADGDVAGGGGPLRAAVQAPPGPPRQARRHWRRVVVAVVVLMLVAAAVWWRRTVTSDPKLEFTSFNRVNRVENDVTGDPGEGIIESRNLLGTQVDIAFVPRQRIFVYLGLRNDGSHTVRIDEVPKAGFYYFGFDGMEVSPERGIGIGQMTTYQPFKPFTLKPGEARNVRLTFRLADCNPTELQPGTTFIQGLVTRYTILGLRRAWLVPFQGSRLAVPTIGRCEHPIEDAAPTGS